MRPEPDQLPRNRKRSVSPNEPVTCLLERQQQKEPSMVKTQLLSLRAGPHPTLPSLLSLAPPLRDSSFPPLPGWAQRETQPYVKSQWLMLLAEQSLPCERGPQQNHKLRFALDSLAVFGNSFSLPAAHPCAHPKVLPLLFLLTNEFILRS